jgi:hypothetical protein
MVDAMVGSVGEEVARNLLYPVFEAIRTTK